MKPFVSQLQAMGLALAAYTCFVLTDTSIKAAGAAKLPVYEVIAILGLAQVLCLLLYAGVRRKTGVLWPKQPIRQFVRSCLDLGNNLGVVVALRHLPLALFYILVFLSPAVTALLAAIFLGERLQWRKGLAILTGFLGVVVAVNPFGASRSGDWAGYVACMVCVSCFSVSVVWSRVMTQTETPESLIFFSGLVQAGISSTLLLCVAAPLRPQIGFVLVGAGLFGVIGSLCFFVALKHTSAANVSQFHYSQLLTGALLAYGIWRERPTAWMWMGAVLIIGAGSYTAASTRRAGGVSAPPPVVLAAE